MAVPQISPEEALDRMERDGYAYIDVRTVPEFECGHPTGAYNVPLMHRGPGGLVPNPDFLAVMSSCFPKDAKLVVGCKMGGRSTKATAALERAGFTNVLDQAAGFDGERSPFGQTIKVGWAAKGLPTSDDAEPGRSWDELVSAVRPTAR